MLNKRINKWLIPFKKYLFYYRDGYYELPYISNSPEIMVAAFKSMPFTKHNPTEQAIYTDNPFTDGVMYYRELEEGFWLILTEIEFKKNICTMALYDGEPCDYYFLSHYRYTSVVNNTVVNDITVPTFGWGLYKPGTEIMSYFNAGTKGVYIDFAFNNAWFARNIQTEQLAAENTIKKYLLSEETYTTWNDKVPNAASDVEKILANLKNEKVDTFSILTLKMLCYNMIAGFFKSVDTMHATPQDTKIKEVDRRHLAKAENMIVTALTTAFPGIETIAKAVHISPTKLKSLFKEVYGDSMFKYYQEKQMLLALEMLKQGISIKNIAASLGYDNTSNFTSAFKKFHGFLASEVR